MNSTLSMFLVSAISGGFLVAGVVYSSDIAKQFGRPEGMLECETYVDTDMIPGKCSDFVSTKGWQIRETYGQAAESIANQFAKRYPDNRWSMALNYYKAELKSLRKVSDQAEQIGWNYEKGGYVLSQMAERDANETIANLTKVYDVFAQSRKRDPRY